MCCHLKEQPRSSDVGGGVRFRVRGSSVLAQTVHQVAALRCSSFLDQHAQLTEHFGFDPIDRSSSLWQKPAGDLSWTTSPQTSVQLKWNFPHKFNLTFSHISECFLHFLCVPWLLWNVSTMFLLQRSQLHHPAGSLALLDLARWRKKICFSPWDSFYIYLYIKYDKASLFYNDSWAPGVVKSHMDVLYGCWKHVETAEPTSSCRRGRYDRTLTNPKPPPQMPTFVCTSPARQRRSPPVSLQNVSSLCHRLQEPVLDAESRKFSATVFTLCLLVLDSMGYSCSHTPTRRGVTQQLCIRSRRNKCHPPWHHACSANPCSPTSTL